MLRRHDKLLLVGVSVILFGGALFLNLFPNEPIWAEWLLGPLVAFLGLVLVIVAVALRCYSSESAKGRGSENKLATLKQVH